MSNYINITNRTDLANALEAIKKQRKDWEANEHAASNAVLYTMLAAALDICRACIATPDLTDGIDSMLKHAGLKYNSKMSLELKVVRLVFADASTQDKTKYRQLSYARVLNVALERGQTSATLAQYIKDQGGIDEIRRNSSSDSDADNGKNYIAVAKTNLADPQRSGLFDPFKLPAELKPVNGSRYSLALIRDNQDGTGTIVQGLKSNALVEKALEEAGKGITEEVARQATRDLLDGTSKQQLAVQQRAAEIVSSAFVPQATIKQPAETAQ